MWAAKRYGWTPDVTRRLSVRDLLLLRDSEA